MSVVGVAQAGGGWLLETADEEVGVCGNQLELLWLVSAAA